MIGTPPEPQPGVPRELVAWRSAQLRDVRYELDLTLSAAVDRIAGRMTVRWHFAHEPVDLVLDWRPAAVTGLPQGVVHAVSANGAALAATRVNDHLVISRAALRPGANAVELEFASPVATAGTAATRYRDREDGSDYVYTLLVPADASTLFPCLDQPDLKARFSLQVSVPPGWTAVANAPLAGTRDLANAIENHMIKHLGLDVGKTYFKMKNENFYIDGYDAFTGLPAGSSYQMVLVPEGNNWRPPVMVPPARKAVPESSSLLSKPVLPPWLQQKLANGNKPKPPAAPK